MKYLGTGSHDITWRNFGTLCVVQVYADHPSEHVLC